MTPSLRRLSSTDRCRSPLPRRLGRTLVVMKSRSRWTPDAAMPADRLLVAVPLRRVHVGIAQPQRRCDGPLADLALELPGAETEAGDAGLVRIQRRDA